MIVLAAITLIAQGVAAAEGDATTATGNTITGDLGVGIALGLAAIGAGFPKPPLAALPLACSPKTARVRPALISPRFPNPS